MRTPHLLAALLMAAAGAGCSGDGADSEVSQIDNVTLAPSDTADPAGMQFTSTITITADGFVPEQAVAVFGETLTFVNDTAAEQTVRFTNGSVNIDGPASFGPIPPGGTVSMDEPLDTSASLLYESDGLPGVIGRLQVDPGTLDL